MNQHRWGLWIWGAATVALAASSIVVIVASGLYLDVGAQFSPRVPRGLPGLYLALKEHGTLLGLLLGFSSLAWALVATRTQH
jgi:hypothetical protein